MVEGSFPPDSAKSEKPADPPTNGTPSAMGPSLKLRLDFFERSSTQQEPTPLARLMGPGRGWSSASKVKTYLAMLWLATSSPDGPSSALFLDPHTMRALEVSTGLPRRSINNALRGLEHDGFTIATFEPRSPREGSQRSSERRQPPITLLQEVGAVAYSPPGPEERTIDLPLALWTGGWLAAMPGQALACLMVLVRNGIGSGRRVWVAGTQLRLLYCMGRQSWALGTRWLVDHDVIVRSRSAAKGTAPGTPYHVINWRGQYSLAAEQDWLRSGGITDTAESPRWTPNPQSDTGSEDVDLF